LKVSTGYKKPPMLVVLAGGLGSRLAPITICEKSSQKISGTRIYNSNAFPKPLLPLGGMIPLMQPLIDTIKSECEIDRTAMVLMYMPEDFRQYYGNSVEYFWDHQVERNVNLDTAGCILEGWNSDIRGSLDIPANYIIPSGDIRAKINTREMYDLHVKNNALATIALAPVQWHEVGRFGTVVREGDIRDINTDRFSLYLGQKFSRILEFKEKTPHSPSNLNNASIYIISKRLFDLIVDDVDFLIDDSFPHRPNEIKLSEGRRKRLGVFSSYLKGEGLIKKGQVNPNFSDWGRHIFPDIIERPQIYGQQEANDPEGLYGFVFDGLWSDDGTKLALWRSNMELLAGMGGVFGNSDFSWWPKPENIIKGNNGLPVWYGNNVKISKSSTLLGPTIIGDNVTIEDNSIVASSVIGSGWTIAYGSEITSSALYPDRKFLGLVADNRHLEYSVKNKQIYGSLIGSGFPKNGSVFLVPNSGAKFSFSDGIARIEKGVIVATDSMLIIDGFIQ